MENHKQINKPNKALPTCLRLMSDGAVRVQNQWCEKASLWQEEGRKTGNESGVECVCLCALTCTCETC